MDWSDSKYFITFIDDYSRYMYRACFVLRTKCWKPLRYSRPKYTENGKAPRAFARFFQEHGIVGQYTMPSSPKQNGVEERRNRTLMDMVRSMRSNINLSQFLWTEALKTIAYVINCVPTKTVQKTPFELFKFVTYMCMGCPPEIRIYNPQERHWTQELLVGISLKRHQIQGF